MSQAPSSTVLFPHNFRKADVQNTHLGRPRTAAEPGTCSYTKPSHPLASLGTLLCLTPHNPRGALWLDLGLGSDPLPSNHLPSTDPCPGFTFSDSQVGLTVGRTRKQALTSTEWRAGLLWSLRPGRKLSCLDITRPHSQCVRARAGGQAHTEELCPFCSLLCAQGLE